MTSIELEKLTTTCRRAIDFLLRVGFPAALFDPISLKASEAAARGDVRYLRRLSRELEQFSEDLPVAAKLEFTSIFGENGVDRAKKAADDALAQGKIGSPTKFRAVSDHVEKLVMDGVEPKRVAELNALLAGFVAERMKKR